MKKYDYPFSPVVDKNSQVLILGSFPSFDSFKYDFYYANQYNAFWKIINDIFQVNLQNNNEKKEFMLKKGIALWDLIASCKRDSSLDNKLKEIKLNDISSLLQKYPNIKKIGCNGKKSYDLLIKNFKDIKLEIIYLTSTSSANASIKYQEKLKIYEEFFKCMNTA